MKNILLFISIIIFYASPTTLYGTKLIEVKVVDKDYILAFFKDGDVVFVDDGIGPYAYGSGEAVAGDNELITYGDALDTSNAVNVTNWSILSSDDPNYAEGRAPIAVYRKSKLTCMSQEEWNSGDYNYDWAYEHSIYLQVPVSLKQGNTYTISINANTNTDVSSQDITYDIFNSKSEAIKVNLNGYHTSGSIKAVDLYMWLGDGGGRDYSSFEGNKVYVYNVANSTAQAVGKVEFWKNSSIEGLFRYNLTGCDVWKADISAFNAPGTYRVAIEGIGCSEDFVISDDVYHNPFQVSLLGFLYMRIGQDSVGGISPVPRRPLYIPDVSPADCKVYITTMQPFHDEWGTFSHGDPWDHEGDWAAYVKPGNPTNPNAYGGHSDALDWDRRLQHVSIIYDMLLPYFLTNGNIPDDDLGLPESGNGIPDILDEARNEVDLWLRLRDGMGYSHGITNPDANNVLYQAGTSAMAAWANAANAAMLANCFGLAGQTVLMEEYRDSAIVAYNYASGLADQMLTSVQTIGNSFMSGADFKMTAAAYLYNITGDTDYEDVINEESRVTNATSTFNNVGGGNSFNQTYALAAYLFTTQPVNYPELYENMKASVIYRAKEREANYIFTNPSRRSNDHYTGWFVTEINVQRCMIAHAISDDGPDKELFLDALVLEADYSLGRNPLNMINMTTATTSLSDKRSVENAYTTGWDDGVPGVHPGHTPYMNLRDWWSGMIMGRPSWMTEKNSPDADVWPMGEMYYNTRYVYAHSEFTPQQTMGGKQALYGYLYAGGLSSCRSPNLGEDINMCDGPVILNAGATGENVTYTWTKDGTTLPGENSIFYEVSETGTYSVTVSQTGCVPATDEIIITSETPAIDLGDDIILCKDTVELNAGVTGDGVSYSWKKDNEILEGKDSIAYEVTEPGIYSVLVSFAVCSPASDTISITSGLLSVTSDTICSAGQVSLSVNGNGPFEWYGSETGGNLLYTGNNYSPTITESTIYYVEDGNGDTTSIGKTETGGGTTWTLSGSAFNAVDRINKVTVEQSLSLNSVDVYVVNDNTSVTININDETTTVHTATVSDVPSGLQTIPLNFALTPGEYTIDAAGTSAPLRYEASGASFPYSYPGYISFTYNRNWQSSQYGFFYNWSITVPDICGREPVYAVIDPGNANCQVSVEEINTISDRIKIYPNPTTGILYLDEESNWAVYNINASKVASGKGNKVDLSKFSDGVYFVRTDPFTITRIVKIE